MRLSAIVVSCLLLASNAGAGELLPHKGVYDLALERGHAIRGVEDVKGRIVFEAGGSTCEGYTTSFRQVVRMSGAEMPERLTDIRSTSFEAPGGKAFRFLIEKFLNGQPDGRAEGRTEGAGAAPRVTISQPLPGTVDLPAGVTFPNNHTKALIAAAQAGQTSLIAQTYDGSEEGRAVYDTTAIIGAGIRADVARDANDATLLQPLSGLTRWPVLISYFKTGSGDMNPVYSLRMELYENGVARSLRLDYGTLVLTGTLSALDLGKMPRCD